MQLGPLSIDEVVLKDLCERWQIAELAVFGSVLRADFRPESDVDLLVTWAPGVARTYFELCDLRDELEGLVGRDVDIAQRHVVEADENKFRRANLLQSARRLYAA